MVKNTYFGLLLQNRKKELDNEYNDVKKYLNGKLKITKKEFMWARHIVGSRNFGIRINGISTNVLAPFGDMLNHSDTNNVSWSFNDNVNAFEFKSNRTILKNEVITIKIILRYFIGYPFIKSQFDTKVWCYFTINTNVTTFKINYNRFSFL